MEQRKKMLLKHYIRPAINILQPEPLNLLSSSPDPPVVVVDPNKPGEEALSKGTDFDFWYNTSKEISCFYEEEDEDNEYSLK